MQNVIVRLSKRFSPNNKWTKAGELIVGFFIAIAVYYLNDKSISSAFIGFITPIIVMLPFQIPDRSKPSNEISDSLSELRVHNKLLFSLYEIELENLNSSVKKCLSDNLYRYSYTPQLTLYTDICEKLISVFNGSSDNDFFFATARCDTESVNWFFDYDQISRIFLPMLYEKIVGKQIMRFNRLFIYEPSQLNNPLLLFLIQLHKQSQKVLGSKFSFKFITVSSFSNMTTNSSISDEMGIWGSHFIFAQRTSQESSGYSFDQTQIKEHTRTFERIWKVSQDIHEIKVPTLTELNLNTALEQAVFNVYQKMLDKSISHTKINNFRSNELTLEHIVEIQNWVKGIQPLSVVSKHN